uniref:Uncharacterized protein n=1 Tax=Setaria italica TaxID=4555 RepID=K4AKT4_SETIT
FPHSQLLLSFSASKRITAAAGGTSPSIRQLSALRWRWLVGAMSFVFRGSRADIEAGGFPGFAPDRRAMRIHAGGRPVHSNSLAFLVTVLLLFMVLNSHQMSPNFLTMML